jgi:putative lipoic acid-binding regulatory protein
VLKACSHNLSGAAPPLRRYEAVALRWPCSFTLWVIGKVLQNIREQILHFAKQAVPTLTI